MTNPLKELNKLGQSVWYDNLNRELIVTGALQRMVDEDGVSGGTSNPSIFEKAVSSGSAYDEQMRKLVDEGRELPEIYDALTVKDVKLSADTFRHVYDSTEGADGFASLEVSPLIAGDTQASIDDAHRLFTALDSPNAMIKIPGTPEGLPAIERCLTDGLNINITLLFGVENYEQVAWAYVTALEKRWAAGQPIDRIASVASFFVSRVDTLIDEKLQEKIKNAGSDSDRKEFSDLLGKAAIANAKIAYAKYNEIFSSPRWLVLQDAGARVQRCLWASTSTKNPEYRDVMYVEPLIGPDTINTMPQNTLDAFREHGVVARTLEKGLDEAIATVGRLAKARINLKAVTDELQVQGVKLFTDSFAKANESIRQKRDALSSERAGARP